MKKLFITLAAALLLLCLAGCNKAAKTEEPVKPESDILVAYFSATGTTRVVARTIADITGGDLYEIKPKKPYTNDDIDYNEENSRATREQSDKTVRPEIDGSIENFDRYKTVFIGHPIWWGEEPRIIDTFVEKYDLSGKTVIDFCTSGGSSIEKSENNLKALCPDSTNLLDGKRFDASADKAAVEEWIEGLGIR